ncbi:hypothetical protein O9X98_09420 [Agrobacterium salinitolerans]|nr:hypothetical protein [Agrobacterium salinitolerans]
MQHIATALRAVGDLANVAAMLLFGWAAIALKNAAVDHYLVGGGRPVFSHATVSAIAADPASAIQYWHLAAAWGLFVASAGCAWMLVLGIRWNYHLMLRAFNR